jgi:hypothetical protein
MSDIKVTKIIPSSSYKVTVEYSGGFTETYLRVSFQNWYHIDANNALWHVDSAKESLELETAFNQYGWSVY